MTALAHWLRARLALGLGLAALGCGGGSTDGGTPGAGGATTFLAFSKDFRGYRAWAAYDVTGDADLAGIHDGSTVIEYLNHAPPSGLDEFPVGTIVVKEATGGTLPHELFAMVKRGGGFNTGLPGWEWFELENLEDGKDSVNIVWHGFGPPAGDTYGGDAGSGCNTCHRDCGNDGVCATALHLSQF